MKSVPFHTFLISSFQLRRRVWLIFRPKRRWIPQKTSYLSSSLLLLKVHWLSSMRWLQWWFGCASFCPRRRNVLLVFYLLRRFLPGIAVEWTRRKSIRKASHLTKTPLKKKINKMLKKLWVYNIEPAISLLSGPSGISRRDRSCATAKIT